LLIPPGRIEHQVHDTVDVRVKSDLGARKMPFTTQEYYAHGAALQAQSRCHNKNHANRATTWLKVHTRRMAFDIALPKIIALQEQRFNQGMCKTVTQTGAMPAFSEVAKCLPSQMALLDVDRYGQNVRGCDKQIQNAYTISAESRFDNNLRLREGCNRQRAGLRSLNRLVENTTFRLILQDRDVCGGIDHH
jgi:hypothetical protein